jgi:hypothetical protein
MSPLRPVINLLRGAWLRFKQRTLCPLAPAEQHMPLMLAVADLERRDA